MTEQERIDLDLVLEQLDMFKFGLFSVAANFNPKSSFSTVHISLEKICVEDRHIGTYFPSLFTFPPDVPEASVPLDNLYTQMKESVIWSPLLEQLVTKILGPLFTEITMDMKFQAYIKDLQSVSAAYIGMGTFNTWHGTPDMRIRDCNIVTIEEEEEEEDSDNDSTCGTPCTTSPGNSTCVEENEHISQLIAITVVASFTEHKSHPELNTLVPAILMDHDSFIVCLYDCKHDVLLISDPKNLSEDDGKLSRSGLLLLWVVIHHR